MLELGSRSEFYHKELSKLINSSDIDKVFIKGEKSFYTYKYLKKEKRGNIFQSNQDIDLILKKNTVLCAFYQFMHIYYAIKELLYFLDI